MPSGDRKVAVRATVMLYVQRKDEVYCDSEYRILVTRGMRRSECEAVYMTQLE